MKVKLALKRLTEADMSLFEWQFGALGQRAICLNETIFVGQFFPAIREATRGNRWIPVDLWIFGPGYRPVINLQRKLIRNIGNADLRLGGELIKNPLDEPDRFNALVPGDYAFFLFEGDVIPSSATVLFVSSGNPDDATLHGTLGRFGLSGRDSMRALEENEVSRIFALAQLPENHPLASFVLTDELREAAIGSAAAAERLLRRARAPAVSAEALRRAREQAEAIGRLGEELVAEYLEQLRKGGIISAFEWVSEINAVAPMDFRVHPVEGPGERIDVKATTGAFDRPVHVSYSELREMAAQSEGPYRIYRVFEADGSRAKLRISEDLGAFARNVIAALSSLPPGTVVDAVSVDPTGITFESAVGLSPSNEGDDT